MKLVAYCRVSTEEQGESGLGLESQEQRIRNYCLALDHELIMVYREVASAGSIDRPMLKAAIEQCEDAGVGLIFTKIDRLSRRVKDFCHIMDLYHESSLPLVSVEDSLDTSSPSGMLVANIMISVAQWERDVISERTKQALAAKRARGEKLGRPSMGGPKTQAEISAVTLVLHRKESIRSASTRCGVPRHLLTRWVQEARQSLER